MIESEKNCAVSFLVTMILCAVPGYIIYRRRSEVFNANKLKLRYSYFIAASAWIIASVFGAVPYVISGSIPDFAEAFFETCSGFTTYY